jgi:hypothetical protein
MVTRSVERHPSRVLARFEKPEPQLTTETPGPAGFAIPHHTGVGLAPAPAAV